MTKDVNLYLVGGAVRDKFRGVQSKDIDFAVEAESYEHMEQWMIENHFVIFDRSPRYFTIRARAPKDSFVFGGNDMKSQTFDFTLCRKERDYTDGRHPDIVEAGTILEDLARRDFTMNAIAIAQDGSIIDPFGGVEDIEYPVIRCVGGIERLEEDGLRILRAIRFYSQLGFDLDWEIDEYLQSKEAVEALRIVSLDRIREELAKSFKANAVTTMESMIDYPMIADLIFNEKGVWLVPTTKSK